MSDAEIICQFMEPKPPQDWATGSRAHPSENGWWHSDYNGEYYWRPRDLTLDAMHEVEARLTDEQWEEYRGWFMVEHGRKGRRRVSFGAYLLHASAEQKATALATIVRPLVKG